MNINRKFRFHDSDGNPVSLNKIDSIACRLWGKEQHEKWYACPSDEKFSLLNWFDVIGGAITESSHKKPSWNKVAGLVLITVGYPEYLTSDSDAQSREELDRVREVFEGHFQLIRHLDRQGYTIETW